VFYGIGSRYVYDMVEVARRAEVDVIAFIDNMMPPGTYPGLNPVLHIRDCDEQIKGLPALLPLVTPGHRRLLSEQLIERGFAAPGTLVDPTAILPDSLEFGPGLQVNAGVAIGANTRFGNHVLVNRSVSIGHDAQVEDFVSFGPGCVLCGSCHIETGAFIGGGATIVPNVRVGRNAIVGAGAVVLKDVAPHTVVAGNPARVIREGVQGYNDVSV
jgi:sugar O-acyltransferase (sialic acid O-acetyltransferase NeuD family)